jgi:hypothetical protein
MAGKIGWVWRPCKSCGQVLHRDEFEQFKQHNGKMYPRPFCPACWPAENARRSAEYRRKNPEYQTSDKARKYRRDHPELQERVEFKRRCKELGQDFEHIWGLWNSHDKLCDVCRKPESSSCKNRLSIDHDHLTGKFRGFICDNHNRGIGMIGDTLEAAEQVVAYLKRAK